VIELQGNAYKVDRILKPTINLFYDNHLIPEIQYKYLDIILASSNSKVEIN
jgi:hypothetical protein